MKIEPIRGEREREKGERERGEREKISHVNKIYDEVLE